MGTTTGRVGLYKPLDDGSELVNVAQDLNGNTNKLDLAVGYQAVTSTTRPSTPYSGKSIFQTDTANSSYFHNGSAPASGGWVEIPNASSTFGSNLKLASGKQIVIGASASGATFAAVNAAAATDFLSGRVSGDTVDRFLLDTDGTHNWGPGGSTAADTNLYRGGANLLVTDDTFQAVAVVAGAGTKRTSLGSVATVANSATETVVGTLSVAANDPVVGAIYRIEIRSNVSFLALATGTWRIRWGGVAGTVLATMGPTILSGTAQTLKESVQEAYVQVISTGATGTVFAMLSETRNDTQGGSVGDVQLNASDGPVTVSTTTTNALVVTWQWGAASASNTITSYAQMERVA